MYTYHISSLKNNYTNALLLYSTDNEMFTNMVRTDGYGIDFILAGRVNQETQHPDLELNDFTPDELQNRFRLWGVDPGQVNIFTASDGHGDGDHEVRRYSAAEYYIRAGFKKINEKILNMKNVNEVYMQAERAITTHKTADLAIYGDYVNSILTNIHILLPFHDDRFTSLRLLNYIGRQRADAEMVNIFVSGGKKYLKQKVQESTYNEKKYPKKRPSTKKEDKGRGRKKKGKKKDKGKGREKPVKEPDKGKRKRRFLPFQQDDRIPLIALGDAAFPSTMKGTIPGLARRQIGRAHV